MTSAFAMHSSISACSTNMSPERISRVTRSADAVSLRLASAIDAVAACGPEVRERVFGEDWSIAWATHNRIAHGYAHIDLAIIRATVEEDLPRIEAALRVVLSRS